MVLTLVLYGGVTKAENNKLDSPRIIPINLIINGKHQTVTTKSVSTDKNGYRTRNRCQTKKILAR